MTADKFKVIAPIAIFLGAILLATVLVVSRPDAKQQDVKVYQPLVDALQVEQKSFSIPVAAQGNVQPRTETTLISEVAGKVIEVNSAFTAGGQFKQGDTLLRIDDRIYTANVKRAEAGVASARSQLAREKGQADLAHREWSKGDKTIKRSQSATDLYLRKPQMQEARARLDSAIAELAQAKADLDNTTIRAPYDALVREKQVDVGQYISQGVPMAVIFAVDAVEVQLPLAEFNLNFLELPNENFQPKVLLSANIGKQKHQWQAKLIRTAGVFDEKTRMLMAVAQVDDPYGIRGNAEHQKNPLRVGTFVTAEIAGKSMHNIIALPQSAMRPGNRVWVIDDDNKLRSHDVEILKNSREFAYISAGLKSGMRVSMTSVNNFIPGTKVRVNKTDAQRPAISDGLLQLAPVKITAKKRRGTERLDKNTPTAANTPTVAGPI